MFCKQCGGLLKPKDTKLECPKCGWITQKKEKMVLTEKQETHEIEVVHEEKEAKPLVDQECPECGHNKAYFWEMQTRAADEPPTKFYRCKKCKHTWRDYS